MKQPPNQQYQRAHGGNEDQQNDDRSPSIIDMNGRRARQSCEDESGQVPPRPNPNSVKANSYNKTDH
jgi:hypothetical protein